MATQGKKPFIERWQTHRGRWALIALMGLAALGLMGSYFLFGVSLEPSLKAKMAANGELIRRETKPTLSPSLFVGKAAAAHQIAQEIPDVLDQLYCYCECDKQQGHKSLLSCYTDGHAAT